MLKLNEYFIKYNFYQGYGDNIFTFKDIISFYQNNSKSKCKLKNNIMIFRHKILH